MAPIRELQAWLTRSITANNSTGPRPGSKQRGRVQHFDLQGTAAADPQQPLGLTGQEGVPTQLRPLHWADFEAAFQRVRPAAADQQLGSD